jgi:serine-type D-Ala-D-Ala carboxypeptidase (penicillin-binding protein 5/6)
MTVLRAVCLCLGLFLAMGVWRAADAQIIESKAPHAVIYDATSDNILYSKAGEEPMIPASMTKIMTAFVVFDRIDLGELSTAQEFVTSERAWREGGFASGGSTMGLEPGQRATVMELLRGMIVVSGNDACIVLAEGISGTEAAFAREMTRVAQDKGFSSANFENATGLYGESHRISAEDLARLTDELITRFPSFYDLYAEKEFTWNGITQPNRNLLLDRFEGADGVKTGHLSQSGYGMVASAERDGRRIIVVVNGLDSEAERAQETERLLRLGFTAFESRQIGSPGQRVGEVEVFLGSARTVGVVMEDAIELTAAKRAFRDGTSEIVYNSPIKAPVAAGEEIAQLVITLPGREPVEVPLFAAEDVSGMGFLERALAGFSEMLFGEGEAAEG